MSDEVAIAERLARVLEGQLDQLDTTRKPWAAVLGVPLPPHDAPDYRARLARDRLSFLEARFRALSAAAERRRDSQEAARYGLDRFTGTPGRFGLDALLEPERRRLRRRWEAAGR